MADQAPILSAVDAERFRAYERQRHDSLAASYHDFFTPVTALAIPHLCNATHLAPGIELLDVATVPGTLAGTATRFGVRAVGVDLSPGMIALAKQLYPATDFRVADVEHLPSMGLPSMGSSVILPSGIFHIWRLQSASVYGC